MSADGILAVQDLRKGLVENAFAFINKALDEFPSEPQFSLIHFATGVELFLKARLMAEHWSLIVARKQSPDIAKFRKGDFLSVSIDETIELLGVTLGDPLNKYDAEALRSLAKHRNKVLHFFHDTVDGEHLIAEIMQCWDILHELLSKRWNAHFSDNNIKIQRITKLMHEHRPYLQLRFDNLKADLKEDAGEWDVISCPACQFEALVAETSMLEPGAYELHCRVCGKTDWAIRRSNGQYVSITRKEGSCYQCNKLDCLVWLKDGGYFCLSGNHEVSPGKVGECGNCGTLCAYVPQGKDSEGDVSAWLRCPECDGQQNED